MENQKENSAVLKGFALLSSRSVHRGGVEGCSFREIGSLVLSVGGYKGVQEY